MTSLIRTDDRVRPVPVRAFWLAFRWRYVLGFLATVAVFALSTLPTPHSTLLPGLKHLGHFFEFSLVGLVYLNIATAGFTKASLRRIVLAMALLVAVVTSDEVVGYVLHGAQPDWRDLLAGASGAYWFLAWAWAWAFHVISPKHRVEDRPTVAEAPALPVPPPPPAA